MRKPTRVKIINTNEQDSAYYYEFVGKEYDVLSVAKDDELGVFVELPIVSRCSLNDTTIWYEGEYEVLELEPSNTITSILKGLDEAIGSDMVTISKERYDELLKYEKLYNMIIM